MRRLLRFHGIRKLAFAVAAWPVYWIASWLLSGGPPDGWYSWPPGARAAVGGIAEGTRSLAFFGWLWLLSTPLRGRVRGEARYVLWASIASAVLYWAVPGFRGLVEGLGPCLRGEVPITGTTCRLLLRLSLVPLAIGAGVAFWPDLSAALHADPTYRRWFVSGQGHAAGWAGAPAIRRKTQALPETPPSPHGHLSDRFHLGRTLFEDSFSGGRDVWLNENSHLITCAMTGSGKFLTSEAANLALHRGSLIATSIKPELADFNVGRRVDVPRLFESSDRPRFRSLGIDTRGVTGVRYTVPGSRAFVLDPTGQSVWPSSRHNFLSEIDVSRDDAPALINAIAFASFPDDPHQHEKFFILASRGLFAASIGHVLTTCRDPALRNLCHASDFCMGIDPVHRRADPDVFQKNLIAMMRNAALGGFIQRSAASIAQLGERAFGSVNAEAENNTRWLADARIRRQLSGESDFSYAELGDDAWPVAVHLVPPRGSADFQALLPWQRTHLELGLAVLETKRQRPRTSTLVLCDEFRQYGESINGIRRGATTLREANVRLWLVVQSWPSLVDIVGQSGANELESCSAVEYFGVNDAVTRARIAEALGKYTLRDGGGWRGRPKSERVYDVVTPAEVEVELRKSSDIKYVFPAGSAPMRLRRVAYKPVVTEEGTRYAGLPLDGHYDDALSRYTYRRRA